MKCLHQYCVNCLTLGILRSLWVGVMTAANFFMCSCNTLEEYEILAFKKK